MGFSIVTSAINHSSDAAFQAWGQELDAMFIAAGWVNTSDTGQVNLSTMVRPAINTSAGYRIYYYNDALHATSPIYLKLEFGTANTNFPQWWATVGQGSDGAGSLTGLQTSRNPCVTSSGSASPSCNTYVSWGFGYFAIAWKALTAGLGLFVVNRFTDSLGAPLNSGYSAYFRLASGTVTQQCVSFSPGFVYAASTAYSMVGGSISNSLIGGVAQTYRHYCITPRMQLNPFMLTIVKAELITGVIFQADVIGTGSVNWMPVGDVTSATTVHGSISYGFAIPWV